MLEARNLKRINRADGACLLDVPQLEIQPGQRVAVRGPSGSGKSLLLRALVLLDRLDGGEVHYQGRRVRHDGVPDFRRRVMYLHQSPALDGEQVEQSLRSPFRLQTHRHARYARQDAVAWLERIGRDESFLSKPVRELSGGEKQITALVRALLLKPDMLLLDEPTAALDAATTRRVEKLVDEWIQEDVEHRALLWVSHDASQAERWATRTIHVEAGRIGTEETPS
jgi:putative ABC transport system ATP-binding protein